MRATFLPFYRPTKKEFDALWNDCLFVLDTNVLLHAYRYTEAAREHLFGLLSQLESRLWIPYQVGLEYQRLRPDLIAEQRNSYGVLQKKLDELPNALASALNPYRTRHSSINAAKIEKPILSAISKAKKDLSRLEANHPDLFGRDQVRDRFDALLKGKVGEQPTKEKRQQQDIEAKARQQSSRPPGNRDSNKRGGGLGDILLWLQTIEHAKQAGRPIILVTDDAKDDWWLIRSGTTLGPKPELIQEMKDEADVAFYMYSSGNFIEHAGKFLQVQAKPAVVSEVRAIRDEETQKFYLDDLTTSIAKSMRLEALMARRFGAVTEAFRREQERTFNSLRNTFEQATIAQLSKLPDSVELARRFGLPDIASLAWSKLAPFTLPVVAPFPWEPIPSSSSPILPASQTPPEDTEERSEANQTE